MVVVPHGGHLCLRLPLFTSVLVRLRGNQLRCEPQLGPFRRTTALVGTAAATGAGVAALAATGELALALTAGAAGSILMLLEIAGLVQAEGCMTRVQMLWTMRLGGAPAHAALGAPGAPERRLGRPPDDATAPSSSDVDAPH